MQMNGDVNINIAVPLIFFRLIKRFFVIIERGLQVFHFSVFILEVVPFFGTKGAGVGGVVAAATDHLEKERKSK